MSGSSFFDLPETGDDLLFLANWEGEHWAKLLVYAQTIGFSAGDTVIETGAQDRAIFVVQSGSLEAMVARGASQNREHVVIGPGSMFGEVSFFDGGPRSATVRGLADGELLRFSSEAIEVMAQREPEVAREFLMDLGRLVAVRLRRAEDAAADER